MVPTYNHFLCEIINKKYQYTHKDWFTGEYVSYDLDFCLTNYEQQKIKSIKDTDFKIVIWYFVEKMLLIQRFRKRAPKKLLKINLKPYLTNGKCVCLFRRQNEICSCSVAF